MSFVTSVFEGGKYMNRALLVIDYTNDFVATEGSLTCGDAGQAIEETLLNLLETFAINQDEIVMAVDYHQLNDRYHPENKLFPPHNINGTAGRELYGSVQNWYDAHQRDKNVFGSIKHVTVPSQERIWTCIFVSAILRKFISLVSVRISVSYIQPYQLIT